MKNRFKLKSCFIFTLILALIMSTVPVMAFAETTDQWVTKAPMSTTRFQFQTAVVDGKIYAVGGEYNNQPLALTEVYDPNTNIWTSKAQLNIPRYLFQLEVIDGKLYAIGGRVQGTNLRTATVERYDPEANKWELVSPMSTARSGFQTVALNHKIYAIGGISALNIFESSVEVYDPDTNTWTSEKPMSQSRTGFCAEAINGKIYSIGGYNANSILSSVEEYDPTENKWIQKQSMLDSRQDFVLKAINGELYAFGGLSASGYLTSVEEYDLNANNWSYLNPMSTPRCSFQAEIINNTIYAIGGVTSQGRPLSTAEAYYPDGNKWNDIPSMINARSLFKTEVINGGIFAIGGLNDNGIASVEEYTPVSSQPDTPTTLTATAGDKQVSLSWSPVAGAAGYNIYRSTTSGGNYTKIASDVTSTIYADTGLTNGVTYYYYVTAVDSSGAESQPSNEASATPADSSSSGYNATLKITMVTGEIKEYNVNSTVVESFIAWFNSKGSESPVFTFEKTLDLGPYTSHTDYLAYDKISSFIVLKY